MIDKILKDDNKLKILPFSIKQIPIIKVKIFFIEIIFTFFHMKSKASFIVTFKSENFNR